MVGVSVALFVLTFLVYWSFGPKETPYDFQLSQANNLIHGHVDMAPELTRNLNVLERVLYDGIGFCLPLDDPRGPDRARDFVNPRITADCKSYMQHSPGPALLLVPLVLIWGLGVNQTLISVLIAALTAPLVFAITRRLTKELRAQVALTVLVMFGTILWWVGSNGGVWFFAHTTAVFFLFGAIYATVSLRSPLLAGALIGAAFMCRPSTILAGFFPLVFFADRWLITVAGVSLWRRVRLRPLAELAIGVAPFVIVIMVFNALRFGSPFESGYKYSEQFYQISLMGAWDHGMFDIAYITRHVAVFWEAMPIFANQGPYMWPSWAGLAMWVTTPPLFYGLFVHLRRNRLVALVAAVGIALACAVLVLHALWRDLGWGGWGASEIPFGIDLLPFWLVVAAAIGSSLWSRDRFVIACWAAIIPLALVDWLFAATGWAQFGYRYGLDFLPFLWLLVVVAVGDRVRWHHLVLIGLAVLVNLWGVLWIYVFQPSHVGGWTWVSF